jgi:hypothetical protein
MGAWMAQALHRPAVVGDTLALGHAQLSVRSLGPTGDIQTMGLSLHAPEQPPLAGPPTDDTRP